ncbi:hypothetical protein TNIN_467121 [Trichonephila inaurata madagascariensis]|uniref:Uncharacterized protein n=1 Tax=Trichonephila inaurata madagascariensis TaxID=2747483 RepID=A0A8X7BY58_9ARAC|nr:hypothetical protein TNIN_467121 [Trichonephila inaurata madagascariensis]
MDKEIMKLSSIKKKTAAVGRKSILLKCEKLLSNSSENSYEDVAREFDENVDKDLRDSIGHKNRDVAGLSEGLLIYFLLHPVKAGEDQWRLHEKNV